MSAYDPKRTPGGRRSISAFGGKGPRAVYLAGGLIGSGGRGVTSATLTVVPEHERHHDAHAVQCHV
jgi:hypothetical protein